MFTKNYKSGKDMLRLFSHLFSAALLVALGNSAIVAQTGNSRISSVVTDPDSGAISGASVVVTNRDALLTRQTKTDDSGAYVFPALPPGHYQVTVEASGFGPRSSSVLTLGAEQNLVFNAQMALGTVQPEVDVTEAGTTVDTTSASISTSLTPKEVTGYGLNGRNFSQLITMAPGVSNQTGQDEAKVGVAGSAKFSVTGGRVEYNTFEVDGSDVLNTSINASRGQGEPLMVYPALTPSTT
jgi:hypothetical protein